MALRDKGVKTKIYEDAEGRLNINTALSDTHDEVCGNEKVQ